MNTFEIEESLSALTEQPLDRGSFSYTFFEGLGNKVMTILDDGEVRHTLPCGLHGKKPACLAERGEVCPQGAAQKVYSIDDDLIIVQDMQFHTRTLHQKITSVSVCLIYKAPLDIDLHHYDSDTDLMKSIALKVL